MGRKFLTFGRAFLASLIVMSALFGGLFSLSHTAHAATGTNQQMNFQGRLFNNQGATVPDGNYNIEFKIYQDGDGQSAGDTTGTPAGTLKWTEDWLNSASHGVQVKNGFVSVQLGSVTPFGSNVNWNSDTLWLSMNIAGTNATCTPFSSCTPDGEMLPMKRLSSAAYALNAAQLGGITASGFIQSTTSPQSANIAVQSANAANVAAVIQGAASQTADILDVKSASGAATLLSVSASGTTNIQPATDSTSLFNVKTSGGSNVLSVDTQNSRVGIGVSGAPSATLHVAMNSTSTATPLTLFEQTGSGNTTMQLKNPLNSWFVGIDAKDSNSFKINSDTAAGATTQVGNTTTGNATDSGDNNSLEGAKVTPTLGGTITSLSVYIPCAISTAPNNQFRLGLYSDSGLGTTPSSLLTQSAAGTLTAGWNTINVPSASVTANTTYWIVYLTNGTAVNQNCFAYTGGTGTSVWGNATFGAMPASWPGNVGSSTTNPSFYATMQTATITNTYSSALFKISGSGQATLHNYTNSTSAFTIQNAAQTNSVIQADTTNNRVGIALGSSESPGYDLAFGGGSNHTIAINQAPSAGVGSALTIQGGSASGAGNYNGGNLVLAGGAGVGTGAQGLVALSASAYTAGTNAACATSCTITQSNVDNYSTILVSTSAAGLTITLPAPTNTTAGRILYITTQSGSNDYTLTANASPNTVNVAMRQNATAAMIWNGTAWTPGGASNATTLQAVYNNGTNPATTPEIKLDSTHGTIDIQDADTSIGSDILDIHASNAGGLGTVLFGVSNTGRVTIQNTADQASSFRALNASGNYVLNINSSNNYVINNSVTTPGNSIANPGFETGGAITSGEEGWFGPAQASIVNDSTNSHGGNYELQVTPNATNIDVYAGSYYEVRPGDTLYFEGWVKNSATANGTGGIEITWYDQNKANPTYSTSYATLPGTSYTLSSINATVPAGAYFARVSATVRSTATTGTYYFDDFLLRKSSEPAPMTFRNSINSSSAFLIQSAGSAETLFTADTTNNVVKIGDGAGTDTSTTLLVLDSATANPTTNLASKNGGLFYRSDTNSLKAVIGGSVVDICTTAVTCAGYSASASSSIQLQTSSPGTVQTGNFNISGTGILTQLQTQDQGAASTNSSDLVIRTGGAAGATSNSGNLILDVGTATGTVGAITIGHAGVATAIPGMLVIQGSNALTLGNSMAATGSILFRNAVGANTVTLKAAGANPTSSFSLSLPQNLGNTGDCLKDTGSGALGFSSCSAGATTNLQNVYDNSANPATITLADTKNFVINAQNTTTSPNVLINLQCTTSCGATNGRFAVQNAGTDVFTVLANGGGIVLNGNTQIGSNNAGNATQINFQLSSYTGASGENACTTSTNQGAMYYNTTSNTIRACINGGWSDITNPEALGLMSYGIVPSSGANPYDLASSVTTGASGPCKVSWASATSVTWQTCVVYSGGKRSQVNSGSLTIGTTTTNIWQHLCINSSSGQPTLTAAAATATANMPAFSLTAPVVCLADIKGSTSTAGQIALIYDTRTFTSTLKEAITVSTAVELGMIADAGPSGIVPATTNSQRLYATVVATDGATSSTSPNAIVATVGPAWVKAISGTAGNFVISSGSPAGYATTNTTVPNNSFYYSAGNTRTSYASTCTASSNCAGSLYVNFIVR